MGQYDYSSNQGSYSRYTGASVAFNVGGVIGGGFTPIAAAQLAQGRQHHAGVVRVQQVMDGGGALAQRGQQQHAVRDALGAGQDDGAGGTGEATAVVGGSAG